MRRCLFALLLASCFNPKLDDTPFACGPGGICPPDYECQSGLCRRPGVGPDAPVRIDARIDRDAPSCDPDQFLRCKDATTAVFCLHDGKGEVQQSCAFSCDESHGLCLQCDPGVPTSCQGDTLQRCSAVGELTTTDCAGWCEEQASVASCVTLAPSNLPADTCLATTQDSFRTAGDVVIDTDACSEGTIVPQVTPGPFTPPSICVLVYKDVRIDAGGQITAAGQNALAIVATGTWSLGGTISVSAVGEMPGAGASRGGPGSGHDATDATMGGGGAGFGLVGPNGVVGKVADPGSAYGRPQLSPLFGGSHGGQGGVDICLMCGRASPGGGGGGAVQIVACNALEVGNNAAVFASGGGGTGGQSPFQAGDGSGGGGGGSGGGILIEAETISVGNNVVASANGGGGGGGGQTGGGENGEPGSDGLGSTTPAPGGTAQLNAGDGGNGGTRGDVSPIGQSAGQGKGGKTGFGSGGSGGSAGRIRVNVRAGAPLPLPGSAVISPPPSVGSVGRNIIP